jgi:hypothetical protein
VIFADTLAVKVTNPAATIRLATPRDGIDDDEVEVDVVVDVTIVTAIRLRSIPNALAKELRILDYYMQRQYIDITTMEEIKAWIDK